MSVTPELNIRQIEAAKRLHSRLTQWRISDLSLEKLGKAMPGWDEEACLLKCLAVNELHGTQLFAVLRMAQHVHSIFGKQSPDKIRDLVENIAALPVQEGERRREFISFASKLCHFFVSADQFPIYDEAARSILKLHLGQRYRRDKSSRYRTFRANFDDLQNSINFACDSRDLDRYLWIAGMYQKWLKIRSKSKPQMNAELMAVFSRDDSMNISDLDILLPVEISREFLRR